MTKQEIFKIINENPVFYLATMDNDQPRVRGMLLYHADKNGIIFHTSSQKDIYEQIMKNPKAELCFFTGSVQIRITGILEQSQDDKLREEIFAHPTRKFLQSWKENGIDELLQIFILKNCTATTWTMETNFDPKKIIEL